MSEAFYLAMTCPGCDEDMYGLVITTLEHRDRPAIFIDMTCSQMTFTCEHCGGTTYVGDIADMCTFEEGEPPEDDDDE